MVKGWADWPALGGCGFDGVCEQSRHAFRHCGEVNLLVVQPLTRPRRAPGETLAQPLHQHAAHLRHVEEVEAAAVDQLRLHWPCTGLLRRSALTVFVCLPPQWCVRKQIESNYKKVCLDCPLRPPSTHKHVYAHADAHKSLRKALFLAKAKYCHED